MIHRFSFLFLDYVKGYFSSCYQNVARKVLLMPLDFFYANDRHLQDEQYALGKPILIQIYSSALFQVFYIYYSSHHSPCHFRAQSFGGFCYE